MGLAVATAGCRRSDEAEWEAARGAIGSVEADRSVADDQWQEYRVAVARSLGAMRRSLDEARDELPVYERDRVDALVGRISDLRAALPAELTGTPEAVRDQRAKLIARFDGVRDDVDALLLRLGHDRRELSAWQNIE